MKKPRPTGQLKARTPRDGTRPATGRLRAVRQAVRRELDDARAAERGDTGWDEVSEDLAGQTLEGRVTGALSHRGEDVDESELARAEDRQVDTDRSGRARPTQDADPGPHTSHDHRGGPGLGLPRFAVVLVTIAAAWLALSFFHELSGIIAPLFFALNLLITAYPLHTWLARHHVPRWLSATTAGLTVILVLAAGVAGMAWSVAAMVGQMQSYYPQMYSLYQQTIELLTRFGYSEQVIASKLKSIDPQQVMSLASSLLSDTSSILTMMAVILTGMIFMVMDTPQFHERLGIAGRRKPDVILSLESFASGIRKYWLVTTIFGIIVALFDWAALLIIGVPLAGVWALFSFLTNYIPNIGFIVGVIPPALLALFQDGWVAAVAVVASYSVLNFVIQSIIQPKFAGNAVGLTPSMSFLSLLLWGWVFGALGTLIALPCSLLVKAMLIDRDPGVRWINALISSDPDDAKDRSSRDGEAEGGDRGDADDHRVPGHPEGATS